MTALEQEPNGVVIGFTEEGKAIIDHEGFEEGWALYTEPPKQEWVGLTDEEIRAIDTSEFWNDNTPLDFARVIENKLKEKNT
jgi:hypothetical protein